MPEKKSNARRHWWLVGLLFGGLILAITWYASVQLPARQTRAVVDAYRTLDMGTSRESLASHVPGLPDLICTFNRAQVLYYQADPRVHFIPGFGDTQAQRINDLKKVGSVSTDELPYLYGYVQILLDTEGNGVIAKAWLGEDAYLHTVQGDFRYTLLNELPAEVRAEFHVSEGESGRVE